MTLPDASVARPQRKVPWIPLGIGLYMGLGAWGAAEGGPLEHLVPSVIVMLLDLPAFIGAAILSGNVHAPNSLVFAFLTFLQWAVLAALLGKWLKHAHTPPTRGTRTNTDDAG